MNEVWQDIPGHLGYKVSDQGRVLGRRGNVLSPKITKKGNYRLVWLITEDGGKSRKVHHLVFEAFVGPRPKGMEACHRDGDPSNNQLTNLRWGTKSSNALDRVSHGNDSQARKTHCPRNHELKEPNLVSGTRGRRCLACHNARSFIPSVKSPGFQELADSYYKTALKKAS